MARKYLEKIGYYGIEKLSDKELRKYYSSLRDIFQKQTKRLEKVNPKQAKPYRPGGISYFGTIAEQKKQVSNKEELRRQLIKSAQALEGLTITRTTTGKIVTDTTYNVPSLAYKKAKKAKKDQAIVASLLNAGFTHITKDVLENFGAFMDEMREQYGKKLPDSIIMAEFYDNLTKDAKKKDANQLREIYNIWKENKYKPNKQIVKLFMTV